MNRRSRTSRHSLALLFALVYAPTAFLPSFAGQPIITHAQEQTNGAVGDFLGVARGWVSALNAHDLEGAQAFLKDDTSVIFVASADSTTITYTGREEIGNLLRSLFQDEFRAEFVEEPQVVNGTTTWVERQTSNSLQQVGISFQDLTVDAIIEDGTISSIIYEGGGDDSIENTGATPGMPRSGQPRAAFPWHVLTICASSILSGLVLRRITGHDRDSFRNLEE
ncbi:MAG TPA: nuclear transport factor 2 family protein [Chloroflexia bacterium]|nr:nuclear transport factor 2 family protein [Chloroflexia bacterium]